MAKAAGKRPVSNPVLGTIRTMQHKARLWALGSSYLAVLVLASALVFAGVLLDHLFVLPREGRAAFLVVFSVTAVVALCAATLLPLTRRLSDLYVAREIERHVPELKNSLISYVQCRTDPRVPREAKRLLVRRVGGSLAALDPHLVSHPKRALTLMWCALAIVVLLGLYAAFSPKSVLVSARRLFMPHARILPPTATRIVDVRPGDGWVAQGTAVQVRALVEGARPQSVYVVWGDSRAAGQRIFLSDKGGRQWVGRFPAALQDIAYHVEAGDTRSENFRITVVPKCVVLKVRTSLVPPSYSGLPPSTVEEGAIDALWGTNATVEAHTSLPPRSGWLEFDGGRRIWMTPDPKRNLLRARFRVTESGSYRVRFRSVVYPDGSSFQNSSPVTYEVRCRNDEAPVVDVLAPEDGLRVPADAVVLLKCRARDDFGVGDVSLRYDVDGISREPLRLNAGAARLSYSVQVRDNWPQGPHVVSSEVRRIFIGRLRQPEESAPMPEPPETPAETPAGERPEMGERKPGQGRAGEAVAPKSDAEVEQTAERILRALRKVQGGRGEEAPAVSARPRQRTEEPSKAGESGPGRRTGKASSGQAARKEQGPRDALPPSDAQEKRGGGPATRSRAQQEKAGAGQPDAGKPSEGGKGCRCAGSDGGDQEGGAAGGVGAAGGSGTGERESAASGDAAGRESPAETQTGTAAGETQAGTSAGERGGAAVPARGGETAVEASQSGPPGAMTGGVASQTGTPAGAGGTGLFPTGAVGAVRSGADGGGPSGAEREKALDQVGRMLDEDRVPRQLLEEIGMNREELRKFLDSYRARREERAAEGPGEDARGNIFEPVGEVVESSGIASDDVRIVDASAGREEKDELRDLFDGAYERLSRRYRELVSAYYKRLSGER